MTSKITGLVLAGAAAYLYYKYTKLSAEQKQEMVNNLKNKGRKLYDDYVPGDLKDKLGKVSI